MKRERVQWEIVREISGKAPPYRKLAGEAAFVPGIALQKDIVRIKVPICCHLGGEIKSNTQARTR
jgi:hypothetical protein